MKFRLVVFFIFGLILFNGLTYTQAQKRTGDKKGDEMRDKAAARKRHDDGVKAARSFVADSIKASRSFAADSAKAARKYTADSLKEARTHFSDSTKKVRKQRADSMLAIKKYKESKHYKDSVSHVRTGKVKAGGGPALTRADSLKTARKQAMDSIATARKFHTDSIKTVQKNRADSLAAIKKYKTSKRHADSVAIAKHDRIEQVKARQQSFRDSISKIRKHSMDSAKVARKHVMDSTKTVRGKYLDSVKVVRKARTDSFAKVKANKEKMAKAKEKKKEEANKFKLELKMKQKHEAWSNKSMLKKRWSPVRKVTQNSFTHYNYYYNANRKMDEALQNMLRSRKENYDTLLGLYPFDPNRDSSMLSSDMDSIIRKVSVGIQIHDPRVKWSNDLYLLLGEAYYYRGRYENASIAFRYIIATDEEAKKKKAAKNGSYTKSKESPTILEDEKSSKLAFLKHKSVHNESILWLARTYTEGHQVENAESILSLLATEKLPEDLKGRLAVEKAFAYLTDDNRPEASKQLVIATNDPYLPDWLRMRAAFINGQLLQEMGDYKGAALSFEKTLSYYPKIDMDFYARKYIAFNKLQAGEDVAEAMKPLKKVLADGKYVNYYDQVYYVLGMLAAKANKPAEAITYFNKSINTPKATKKQKSISFAALGDAYYSTASYTNAKRAYDSSAKYAGSTKDKVVAAAAQRSKVLSEISGPAGVIHDQDSLLELANMSRKTQEAIVRRAINAMEKRKRDSIQNAENAGANSVAAADPDEGPGANGWYFSNATLMQQGSSDFKRKWGNRPLADNWRRASAVPMAAGSATTDNSDAEATGAAETDNGLPTEASLLARIPNTPQQKELAEKMEQRAYVMLAKAYVKELEDYKQATQTLDSLDKRFPNHNQKEEELYMRYQIAIRLNMLDKAQAYSRELIDKFPNSVYATILKPKQSEANADALSKGKSVGDYFDETYNLLLQHQYTEGLMRIGIGKKQYSDPVYQRRFQVAEAMGLAGAGDFNKADTVIADFIKTNPADTLTPWALTVQKYIREVRDGGKPSWYKDWQPPKADSGSIAGRKKKRAPAPVVAPPPPPPDIPSMFIYTAEAEHYCIIALPGLDSRTAALKSRIKDYNSAKFASSNLDIVIDLYDIDQSVLVVRKFVNADQARAYMSGLIVSDAFKDYKDAELKALLITTNNYKKLFADKNAQPYFSFYSAYYK